MSTIRTRIDSGFESFGRAIYRNRMKTLLFMAVLIAGLLSQLPKLTTDTSNEGYFRTDDPVLVDYHAFKEQFGSEEMIVLAIKPPEVFDLGFLARLRELHEALEKEVPYLDEVTSLINVRNTRGAGDELIVEDLLEKMPDTPEAMATLKERVLASAFYPNLYVSEDGKFATVVVETLAFSPGGAEEDILAGFEEGPGEGTVADVSAKRIPLTPDENMAVVKAVEDVAARFRVYFPISIAGSPVLSDYFNRAITRDVATFMSLAFLTFAVLLLLLFRRFTGVVLPMIVVMFGMLSSLSLMALFNAPMTTVSTILPSFLTAVGVGSSVHVLAVFFRRFQQDGDKEGAVVYALGHSGLPVFMTGVTTAAGLFSFSTAGLVSIADLGVFGGIGVLVILVYTLVLIPALLAIWPLRQHARFSGKRHGLHIDRLLTGIADFSTSHARGVVIVIAVIVAIGASGLASLRFSHNIVAWFPHSSDVRQSIDLIDEELKGSATLEVVIDTGEENGLYDPAVMNGIEALGRSADEYRSDGGVQFAGKTVSVLNVLKETHQALNENRREFHAIPQNRKLIAQELLLFENSGSDDLEKMVDSRFSKARLSIKVLRKDAAAYVAFVDSMERRARELFGDNAAVTVTGTVRLFTQTIHLSLLSMARSYRIAGIVITILMILLLSSFRFGLISMIPNLAPIVVTMGMMGWMDIPLDMSNMLLGTVAIGLAVDDTIHFFHNYRRYYTETRNSREAARLTMLTTGRAMMFTTLVLVTGFWLFMFASLINLIHFGFLIGLTLIIALLADILLAPAIMELLTRTERGRRTIDRWGGDTKSS